MEKKINQLDAQNRRIGYWEYWDDGILREAGNYVDGKRDGEWVYHSPTAETRYQFHQHQHETDVHYGTGNYDQE